MKIVLMAVMLRNCKETPAGTLYVFIFDFNIIDNMNKNQPVLYVSLFLESGRSWTFLIGSDWNIRQKVLKKFHEMEITDQP